MRRDVEMLLRLRNLVSDTTLVNLIYCDLVLMSAVVGWCVWAVAR